jgi:hypothetical protein
VNVRLEGAVMASGSPSNGDEWGGLTRACSIGGNLVIFETRYYYYFLPSFQKKVGNTITKYLVLKNY